MSYQQGTNNISSSQRCYLKPDISQSGKVTLFNCITNKTEVDVNRRHIHDLFRAQMLGPAFPCALGKAAFARGTYRFGVYDSLDQPSSITGLYEDLVAFVQEQPSIGATKDEFSTFVAVFREPLPQGEVDFENKLWALLQSIHNLDSSPWDPKTSSDPDHPDFSFSVASQSFFLVGMHGLSSRYSRRFIYPAIAFNAHHQFERLRTTGNFLKMQTLIRNQDIKIQGDINPSLKNFGSDSEAKQYSGREVEKTWKCPFTP